METTYKYINPLTDFGFKRIFGTEANVDLLIDFLNTMLPLESPIVKLVFRNVEQVPDIQDDRKAIYDLYCHSEDKKEFIIEMQKGKLLHFRERSLFYLTFPIRGMSKKGNWNFELQPIYYLSLMDFFYEEEHRAKLERTVQLKDNANKIFYKKLLLKFIQLPAFKKGKNELKTRKDQWFYFLRNLENLGENMHELFKNDKIFSKMITIAEIAKLSPDEYESYQVSRMQYLEIKGVADTAFMDGEQAAEERYVPLLQQAEAKTQAAEAKAMEERRQKEEAEAKAKEERRQKEEERRQKEELGTLFVKMLHQAGKTAEEISSITNMAIDDVQKIIAG